MIYNHGLIDVENQDFFVDGSGEVYVNGELANVYEPLKETHRLFCERIFDIGLMLNPYFYVCGGIKGRQKKIVLFTYFYVNELEQKRRNKLISVLESSDYHVEIEDNDDGPCYTVSWDITAFTRFYLYEFVGDLFSFWHQTLKSCGTSRHTSQLPGLTDL